MDFDPTNAAHVIFVLFIAAFWAGVSACVGVAVRYVTGKGWMGVLAGMAFPVLCLAVLAFIFGMTLVVQKFG
jgi:hypothetical protein